MALAKPVRVLVAVQPRLAADLIRRGVASAGVEVRIAEGIGWWFRRWDIAVLSADARVHPRARCLVLLPAQLPPKSFEALLRAISAGECFAV
jgi:hypothetical protein